MELLLILNKNFFFFWKIKNIEFLLIINKNFISFKKNKIFIFIKIKINKYIF